MHADSADGRVHFTDCYNGVEKSPLWDGSEYSLGGDGEYVKNHRAAIGGAKPGTGGGCLKKGTPFANFTVNLGPVGSRDPLKYNPRCFKRDLNSDVCRKWATLKNTTDVILQAPDITLFQAIVQGDGRWAPAQRVGAGVHGGGHFSISGDRECLTSASVSRCFTNVHNSWKRLLLFQPGAWLLPAPR